MAKPKKGLERRRVTVNVCLDGELLAQLDAAAQRLGASRSELLRRLVREGLEREGGGGTGTATAERRRTTEDTDHTEGERQQPGRGTGTAKARDEERIPWEQVKGKLGL